MCRSRINSCFVLTNTIVFVKTKQRAVSQAHLIFRDVTASSLCTTVYLRDACLQAQEGAVAQAMIQLNI